MRAESCAGYTGCKFSYSVFGCSYLVFSDPMALPCFIYTKTPKLFIIRDENFQEQLFPDQQLFRTL